jgi:hypothetical protein
MTALVIDLRPVRNAVEQAQRMGRDEPRQSIVARVVADIRDGHHPYREAQRLQAQCLAAVHGGAA